jgi:murein DD-endopeptidase MepM/ murein hydrolase activator NlpD
MIRKETPSDRRPSSEESLESFGRWLCGHSPSEKHLSIYSKGFAFKDERAFFGDAFSNATDFQDTVAIKQFDVWDRTLTQAFVAWCAQDWLKPIPGLLEVVPEFLEPRPLTRRGEFLRYGSDFLRYKSATASIQCSRIALFLAGGLRHGADSSETLKFKNFASAFFLNSSSASLGKNNSFGGFHRLLRRLSAPPRLFIPEMNARRSASPTLELKFAVLLPWDKADQPWSTPMQVTTAIAFALPVFFSSAKVQPSWPFGVNPSSIRQETSVATQFAPAKLSLATHTNPAVGKVKITFPKPTGRMANIQTYILPAKGEFTSEYGWRWGRMHRGIDIAGPVGTPVIAAASGKVITAGWDESGFGNRIEIEHPDGTVTLYGHNSKIVTRVGATVRQGQQIAEMGSTGHSTGSHLHFQIHPSGKEAVNPISFFSGQKFLRPSS